MVAMSQATPQAPRAKLLEGRMMMCPRCRKARDILAFHPMKMIDEFAAETTPIYKCPSCHWMFAPADNLLLQELMKRLNGQNGEVVHED